MKVEMRKKQISITRVMTLMAETAANRHQWITECEPPVHEILDSFPALENHSMVSSNITQSNICLNLLLCIDP